LEDVSFEKIIWSVAGGKGGTGKSIITANLGIGLSIMGFRVILIDGDLGGPNLHNYLNIKKPKHTLNDFISSKISNLNEIILDTPLENLKIISGGTELLGVANLPYMKKEKILRHINNLDADIIIMDLGSGTSYNTLDFFNLSNKGIIISNPEPNAKYDAYHFLKNAIFRKISKNLKKDSEVKKIMNKFLKDNMSVIEISKFMNYLKSESKISSEIVENFLYSYKPKLIMNKIRKKNQIREGDWFVNIVKNFLIIDMDYVGYMKFDDRVVYSSEKIVPFIFKYPKCAPTKNIFQIIDKLCSYNSKQLRKPFEYFKKEIKKYSKYWSM